MEKIRFIAIVIILSLASNTLAYAGVSQTQNFRVSVTLPAVVGLNVPAPEIQNNSNLNVKQDQQISKEEITRDNQIVLLETITAR